MKVSRLTRFSLCVSAAAAILAGCGAPQSGLGILPQSASGSGSVVQPDAACPTVGKIYTTGKGHAKVRFNADKFVVGGQVYAFRARLLITNWSDKHPLPSWTMLLTTCGPQSGKKPIGKILNGPSQLGSSCHGAICDYRIEELVHYQSPMTLPNGKPWKYDEIAFKFKTRLKGWGTLPSDRIEITK